MATSAQVGAQPSGLVAISRAVVSAAAELVVSVERAMVGDANVRTARGNAWDAIQADRSRAQARDDMAQLVRSLMAQGPRTDAQAHGAAGLGAERSHTGPTVAGRTVSGGPRTAPHDKVLSSAGATTGR